MDIIEIPEYFICPISLQIMKDPVTAITGITYDRESIEHWLFKVHNTICPVTKQVLPIDSDLIPNHTLRRLIQAWCIINAAHGIDRIPTPKTPLDKFHVINLIRDLWVPNLQLKTLQKLEVLALENDRNKKYMVEAGVVKSMVSFIVSCYKKHDTTGLTEAISIFFLLMQSPSIDTHTILLFENDEIIDALTWVLGFSIENIVALKNQAVLVLKSIIGKSESRLLERLKLEFFQKIVNILREGICEKKSVLQIMLDACPFGKNRVIMVEAGAVFELVELELSSPEKATELIFGILLHLCSCADGRAQFLSHAAGISMVTKRIFRVSPEADNRAMLILALICKFSATSGVLQEMLSVGTVAKLCFVLQVECDSYVKVKAREILQTHFEVWKNSPCIEVSDLTKVI